MRRVLNIDVTKPQLKPPRVVPRIREQMATRVPQHVRMRVRQPCTFARALDHLRHVEPRHRAATLGREHERALRLSPQFAQRPQLVALDRVHARGPAFEASDVEVGASEVDLAPFEINGLADPQSMPSHQQDQRRVAMPIAALT
jgi:hypothetical protein